MQQVSAAFLAEIVQPHSVYSYAQVTSPTGVVTRLELVSGAVVVDRTADIRRRASIVVIDENNVLTPLTTQSALAPFGSVLTLFRGVEYTTGPRAGSTEVVQLGVFRLSDATVTDTTGGTPTISIDAYDMSRTISRAKFTTPYNIAQGTNCIAAAQAIIARTIDDPQYDAVSSSTVTAAPFVYDTNDDPWQVCELLAASAGCEIFFTATGTIKIAPPVDVDNLPAPVFTYTEGEQNTMIELDVQFTDDPGYNGVVVIGQAAGDGTAPVRSVAWDTEPTSPTYYLGPYGQVPMIVDNAAVSTQADADAAALAQLNLVLGFSTQLTVQTMVNPALDANDVIAVTRARMGIDSTFALDSVTIPLEASGASALNLRQKRVI